MTACFMQAHSILWPSVVNCAQTRHNLYFQLDHHKFILQVLDINSYQLFLGSTKPG